MNGKIPKDCTATSNVYYWYWKSNTNPWDQREEDLWSPYPIDANFLIEKAFNEGQSEAILGEYKIIFHKGIQVKIDEEDKVRQVKRSTKNEITNLNRINKFGVIFRVKECSISQISEMDQVYENISIADLFEIKFIDQELDFFKKKIKLHKWMVKDIKEQCDYKNKFNSQSTLEDLVNILKKEFDNEVIQINNSIVCIGRNICDLNEETNHFYNKKEIRKCADQIKIYKKFLESIFSKNQMGIFPKIINMYTQEGFLFYIINQILRLESLKHTSLFLYFLLLQLSIQQVSNSLNNKLLKKDLIRKNNQILLFRGQFLPDKQFEDYKNIHIKKENKFVIINEFLSTSWSLEISKKFIKNCQVNYYVNEKDLLKTNMLAYINEYSEFAEEEVLLSSGVILKLINVGHTTKGEDKNEQVYLIEYEIVF